MHRVFAETDDRNAAVRRSVRRSAFRCEARLVEADWFKGEWSTLRVYAMLNRQWRSTRRRGREADWRLPPSSGDYAVHGAVSGDARRDCPDDEREEGREERVAE